MGKLETKKLLFVIGKMLWHDDLYLLRDHLVSSNNYTSIFRLIGFSNMWRETTLTLFMSKTKLLRISIYKYFIRRTIYDINTIENTNMIHFILMIYIINDVYIEAENLIIVYQISYSLY